MKRPLKHLLALLLATLAHLATAGGVTTKVVEYADADGNIFEGFLATPVDTTQSRPGVLVVHEWWGLNDYARERATQLAEAGYVAFAPDMYGKGRRSDTFEGAGALAAEIKNNRPLGRARGELAIATLSAQPGVDTNRLAAIGYCFGGTCVLEFARAGANLAGVVSFHGSLDTPLPAQPGTLKARVLICHGAADPFVPVADVAAIQQELTAAGADWQLIQYGGCGHGFTNPHNGSDLSKGMAYNAAADRRSWALMLDFFNEIFGR